MDLGTKIAVGLAVLTFLFGFYKWIISRNDKRKSEINSIQDQKLSDQSAQLKRHSEKLRVIEQLIRVTREEMVKGDARISQIEKLENTIEKLEGSIDHKLDSLHSRVGGIAKDLNQSIGAMRSMQESQIAGLVKDIKHALEKKDA